MDENMMNKQWNSMVKKYTSDPTKTNVKTDKSTWTITYDEVAIHEIVGVRTEDEDFLLNSPA